MQKTQSYFDNEIRCGRLVEVKATGSVGRITAIYERCDAATGATDTVLEVELYNEGCQAQVKKLYKPSRIGAFVRPQYLN